MQRRLCVLSACASTTPFAHTRCLKTSPYNREMYYAMAAGAGTATASRTHALDAARSEPPHVLCQEIDRPRSHRSRSTTSEQKCSSDSFHGAALPRPRLAKGSHVARTGAGTVHKIDGKPSSSNLHALKQGCQDHSKRRLATRCRYWKRKATARLGHRSETGAPQPTHNEHIILHVPSIEPSAKPCNLTDPPLSHAIRSTSNVTNADPLENEQREVVTQDFDPEACASYTPDQFRQLLDFWVPEVPISAPSDDLVLLKNAANAAHTTTKLRFYLLALLGKRYRIDGRRTLITALRRQRIRESMMRQRQVFELNVLSIRRLCHELRKIFNLGRKLKARLGERAYSNLRPYTVLYIRASYLHTTAESIDNELNMLANPPYGDSAFSFTPLRESSLGRACKSSKSHERACSSIKSSITENLRIVEMLQSLGEEQALGHAALLQIMEPFKLFLSKYTGAIILSRKLPSLRSTLPTHYSATVRAQLHSIEHRHNIMMEGFRRTIITEVNALESLLEDKTIEPTFAKCVSARGRNIRQGLVDSILRYMVDKTPGRTQQFGRFGYKPARWHWRMRRQLREQQFPISMRVPLRFHGRELQPARAQIRKALARVRRARALKNLSFSSALPLHCSQKKRRNKPGRDRKRPILTRPHNSTAIRSASVHSVMPLQHSRKEELIRLGRALLAKMKSRLGDPLKPSEPVLPNAPRAKRASVSKPKVILNPKGTTPSSKIKVTLRGLETRGPLISSTINIPTLAHPKKGTASKTQRSPVMFTPSPQKRLPKSSGLFTDPSLDAEYVIPGASPNINQCTNSGSNSITSVSSSSKASKSSDDDRGIRNTKESGESPNKPERMNDSQEPDDGEDEHSPNDEGSDETNLDDILETHTPLSYQIPTESLRAAMQASDTTRARYYSHALYRGPEDQRISLHYCVTKEIGERVAKYFLEEKVVGFDIEWKPFAPVWSIKENASLIQLACEDRIALFHIALFKGNTAEQLLPQSLKQVIESQDIVKAGVNIKGDFTRLEKYLQVKPQGKYELSRLHNVVEYTSTDPSKVNNRLVSLATQVHQHLLLPLHKGEVRESDWSKRLTPEQLSYAFTDAYAGFRLFDALEAKRKMLRPIPPRPPVTDFDPMPRIRDGPRPKRVKKPAAPKAAEAVVKETEPEKEVDEIEEEDYETAAEEFPQDENEQASSVSESSIESSDDSDTDYAPRVRQVGRAPMDVDGAGDDVDPVPCRVGRLRLAQSSNSDPGYPRLPVDLLVEEDNLAEDEIQVGVEDESNPRSSIAEFLEEPSVEHLIEDTTLVAQAPIEIDDFGITSDEEKDMAALVAKLEITDETAGEIDSYQQDDQLSGIGSPEGRVIEEEGDRIMDHAPKASIQMNAEAPKRESDQIFGSGSSIEQDAALVQPHRSIQFRPVQITDNTLRTYEYTLADTWANDYLVSSIPLPSATTSGYSRVRATMPHLRAYHLWHHQALQVDEIARHLRDPPLSQSTVCGYILQAVNLERLECDKERGREVLRTLPLSVRMSRFKGLSERLSEEKG